MPLPSLPPRAATPAPRTALRRQRDRRDHKAHRRLLAARSPASARQALTTTFRGNQVALESFLFYPNISTTKKGGAMSYACPVCNNEGTQRVSMAYQSGVSIIDTTSVGVATGIGSGPTMLGIGKTRGTSQTETSRQLSPPEKISYVRTFIGGIFSAKGLVPYSGSISLYRALRDAYNYNQREYPSLIADWHSQFLCLRCGHRFIPQLITTEPENENSN